MLGKIFPIVPIIYMAIRVILSALGGLYLSATKLPISNMMFQHGIWAGGASLNSKDSKKVVDKIKGLNYFKEKLYDLASEKSNSFQNSTMNLQFYRYDSDLAYSIGSISFKVSGVKNGNKWRFSLRGNDVYDFHEAFKGQSKKDLANTLGTVMQYTALLVPYNTKLNFSYAMTI